MPMELSEKDLREQAEDRRQLLEEVERKKKAGGFQNGAEALQAFRDLFDSDEEMEAFGDHVQQLRDEERARYRD
jgi:flagellar motor protein MotB